MNSTMKIFFISFGLFTGLFILAACTPYTNLQIGGGDLTGSVRSLSVLEDKDLVTGSSISAQFNSDGKVSRLTGCNQYIGTYTVSVITLKTSSPLASTRMVCSQEIMYQENTYLTALGEVKTFTLNGDQLTLNDVNNISVLVYRANLRTSPAPFGK